MAGVPLPAFLLTYKVRGSTYLHFNSYITIVYILYNFYSFL
nr:MAG TPA: hypothetical protein [Caudoviricetes sp.]